MELTDYLAALRRHWRIWVALTLAGTLAGVGAALLTPKTYAATAQVFVSVSPSIPNSAQFVNQRVKTYPDVAVSAAVLEPVIDQLDLDESPTELQARVSAAVPVDTSQVDVTVTGRDAQQVARIANAVAEEMTGVVEDLETPSSGNKPVRLTVSDPATAPSSPVSPVARYDIGLGLLVGLFLGLAAAVVRSRLDTTVHDADGLRSAWGADLPVLAPGRRLERRTPGRTAIDVARRLEIRGEQQRARVVVLSPSPADRAAPQQFAAAVAAELRQRRVDTAVTGPVDLDAADDRPGVVLTVADPHAPLRFWREVGRRCDGAVLVVTPGRVDAAELHELRVLLEGTGVEVLAAVLTAETPAPAGAPRPESVKRPEPAPAGAVR